MNWPYDLPKCPPAPKPIIVRCQCGWEGSERDLISFKEFEDRYCPVCSRAFKAVRGIA